MALADDDIVLIEKYVDDILDRDDQKVFDEKLHSSPEFVQEVELRKSMLEAIRMEDKSILRQELKKEAKNIVLHPINQTKNRWTYAIAASIAILIAFSYFLLPSSSSLFHEYYVPFPESPITRSESGEVNDYAIAMQQYSVGDFENALATLLAIDEEGFQDEVNLYIGNCYLSLNNPEKAIDPIQKAIGSDNEQIKLQAQWYCALTYIRSGNKLQAINQLEEIASTNNTYVNKSKILIKKLRWAVY